MKDLIPQLERAMAFDPEKHRGRHEFLGIKEECKRRANLDKALRDCVAALEYVGHECMHSHDICPTREQMQIATRKAIAALAAELAKEPK